MQKRDGIIIFIVGVCLFTWGLSSQEIIGFESRFYLFALEMWRHGVSWFPTTYQQPYPDYPVTSTLLIYLSSLLFGHLDKLTAVLPSAVAAAATLCVTYLIGAKYSRLWGWAAVCFLLFTLAFVSEARTISLDQYVTLITALCFYLIVTNSARIWAFAPLFMLGFAFRGPIGIVIPAGVVCVTLLLDKNIKRFFIIGFLAAFMLVICSGVLLIIAHHVGGMPFVQDVLRMEVTGRMQDVKTLPFTFYFKESLGAYAITYPLAILVIAGCLPFIYRSNTTDDVKLLRKCLGWALVILIGLSIPADKKIRYILPMVPALALICGYLFASFQQDRYLALLRKGVYVFCSVFPLIALAVLTVLYKKQVGINYSLLYALFIIMQLVIIILRKNTVVVLGIAALTFLAANMFIVEVISLNTNRTRDFVLQVETLREKYQTPLVFFQEGSDGLPIKYIVNMTKEAKPVYLYQLNELLKLKSHTIVIVGKENFLHVEMKYFHIVMRGKIGHDEVVVLERN